MHCIEINPTTPLDITRNTDTPPRINLATSEDVRREMARIYRDARLNRISANDGTKLTYILGQILKAHEIYSIEKRLSDLEVNNQWISK
jgi:hypothetical protein